ncbi:MAG: hypothetical protein KAQ82_03850 [Dehalococcoidia bacterium]|nr:hypothetical protein [Dehalococcoidia bacterium]
MLLVRKENPTGNRRGHGYPGHFPSSREFFKQYYRSFFIQGLVIVAALGRLHAGVQREIELTPF